MNKARDGLAQKELDIHIYMTNKSIKRTTKHHDIINTNNPTKTIKIKDHTQKNGRITFNAHVRVLQKQMTNQITIKD